MRQLSVPGRTAVWIAASLAALASAGCMSVSDDGGGKPAPSRSAAPRGGVTEPDGGRLLPGGQGQQAGGNKGSDDRPAEDGSASPVPSDSASADAKPSPTGRPPASRPSPPPGGQPSASASQQPPPQPSQEPQEPPVDPPDPSASPADPTDPPSASSAPEVHAGAMRVVEQAGERPEPTASPRVRPYGSDVRYGPGPDGSVA